MSLQTAAAISGVRAGASLARHSVVAVSESSQSRSSPTVKPGYGLAKRNIFRQVGSVKDQAADLIRLIGDEVGEERSQRKIG